MPSSLLDILYKKNYQKKKKRRLMHFLIIAGVGGSISLLALFLLWRIEFGVSSNEKEENVAVNIEDLPVIKANPEPYKIYPKDPGGLKILHQDKEIYKRVKNAKNKKGPFVEEREAILLPFPEIPLEIEEKKETEIWEETFENLLDKSFKNPEDFLEENNPTSSISLPEKVFIYSLQVGKFSSREEAYQEWRRLSLHYGELLKDVSLSIVPTPQNFSQEGGFQLFLGQFTSKEDAETFCMVLQKEETPCKIYYKEGTSS